MEVTEYLHTFKSSLLDRYCQFYATAALPLLRESTVTTEERTGWNPQRRGEQKNLSVLGIKLRFPGRLDFLLITTWVHK
jgi:hypothetical protein